MSGLQVNTVYCPPRLPIPTGTFMGNSYPLSLTSVYLASPGNIFPLATRDSMPDLLITVNFTTLEIPVDTMTNMFNYSLRIMIGFTNDTRTVIDRTQATTLVPGTNLFGAFTWQFRQLLKKPGLSAFTSLFNVIIAEFLLYSSTDHDFILFSRMRCFYCRRCSTYILTLWCQCPLLYCTLLTFLLSVCHCKMICLK